jgi:segregation and condensation protein B
MSLKAKIEAVIYASEEPVTLAQLVGLLGLEAQAELDREAADQRELLNEEELEAAAEEPTLGPDFDSVGGDPASEDVGSPADAAVVPPTQDGETILDGAPDAVAEAAAAAKAEKARTTKLRAYFRVVLDRLVAEYAAPESDRGLEIREVAGGFRFGTKPEYHDAVRGFVKSLKPPLKLTLQALETLAVVAYKQPVTAPEISEIRGVDSSGVLGSLLARKLIATAGRKHVIGRPILYKTTREFLLKFGLKDVAELPSIEEFEKMAGQMAEQEEIPMEHEESPKEVEERLESDGEAQAPEPVADEVVVDGRLPGLPPKYDDADDPSAVEAEIQESGE